MSESRPVGDVAAEPSAARAFDAVIFDMDGVLTRTATTHAQAWKRTFDEFLQRRGGAAAQPEFSPLDYLAYVDGRPRYRGVEAFLRSRGITLPPGTPDDSPDAETVCGLGNRKNACFNELVARDGVRLYESTLALLRELRDLGVPLALATSSRNAALILEKTQTAGFFGAVVDGVASDALHLKGKPEPDIFIAAARGVGAAPERAIVVEDAVSGVEAGRRGGFALVVGLAREHNADRLLAAGADLVVADLAETSIADLDRRVREKCKRA